MTLPTSRNTTYTGVVPVKSADLNALQDCVIAGKFGPQTFQFPGINWIPTTAGTVPSQIGMPINSSNYNAMIGFEFPVGTVITAARFSIKDNATGPTRLIGSMIKMANTGTPGTSQTGVGSTVTSSGTAGTNQVMAIPSGLPYIVVAGTFLMLNVSIGGSGTAPCWVIGAEVDAYKP